MKIKLHKSQHEVAQNPSQYRVICAGRRWGKSVLARLIVMQWAIQKEGLYWIVAPTYGQGKKIHWLQGFRREAEHIFGRGKVKFNDSELRMTLKENGATIQIVSGENPDVLVGVKLRGLVVDEVSRLRNWSLLWKEALLPTTTDYKAPVVFISTPRGYNHFYQLYMLGQDKKMTDWKSWRFTSYDNPYIPHSELDKNREIMTENYFQQEYMAQFKKFVGLVYPTFEREIHIKDTKIEDFNPVYWLRGLDRGFRNPTAMPLVAVNSDGVWYQTAEIYQAGLTNPKVSDLIKQVSGERPFELSTMDSADASDIQDLNDIGDLDFIPVRKEAGEAKMSYVRWKIEKFSERLRVKANGKPSYYVHPRNENTIMEFEKYAYPETKEDEQAKEVPIKLHDHMMDSLGDLNSMYYHMYEEKEKKPWADKMKGTFIPPFEDEVEEKTGWNTPRKDDYWDEPV